MAAGAAGAASATSVAGEERVSFLTEPGRYRHWRLVIAPPVATLAMNVAEDGGLGDGYELKLNSYDLGVDIELYDAVQRLRFEHPEVHAVVITSVKEKVFCAGANIRMLAQSPHGWKVNFCKFTNETRNGIEDATACSGQAYIAALNGTASGGGYELALACEHIMLIDDRSSVVALPELPLLGVLPGTGGLTRVTDKRHVRRDLADYFATRPEGVGGRKAVAWRLVDEAVSRTGWDEVVAARARELAARSSRPGDAAGIVLTPLDKVRTDDMIGYRHVSARLDHLRGEAAITVRGPDQDPPANVAGMQVRGAEFWPLAMTRELDDLILDLRTNEPELGTWVLRTEGDPVRVLGHDRLLLGNAGDWLANEIVLYLKRTLRRLDVTSRSLIALIEPGSCFAGSLLELALAADRSYMLAGLRQDGARQATDRDADTGRGAATGRDADAGRDLAADRDADAGWDADMGRDAGTGRDADMGRDVAADPDAAVAVVSVNGMNTGPLTMSNGLTRLQTRFFGDPAGLAAVQARLAEPLGAEDAEKLGLVTFAPDDLDWDEEVRIAVEERASFSPDALTGMEANYRFAGQETMETKIFGRLSAWQNWIFTRPNASGPDGALRKYGTGQRASFDRSRA
jgi:benzoyl-CoA-dihydrodiol lyase